MQRLSWAPVEPSHSQELQWEVADHIDLKKSDTSAEHGADNIIDCI
jgi:hypothetical protein